MHLIQSLKMRFLNEFYWNDYAGITVQTQFGLNILFLEMFVFHKVFPWSCHIHYSQNNTSLVVFGHLCVNGGSAAVVHAFFL